MLNKRHKIYLILTLAAVLAGYFAFGLYRLDKFDTDDEHYWVSDPAPARIDQYWQAVKSADWKDTRINDKPGVSIALISGIGTLLQRSNNFFSDFGFYRIYNPAVNEQALYLHRAPLLIFNGLLALVLFWLVFLLLENIWIALWSYILILLSPVLLGMSRIVNPDAVIWSLSTAVILAFLVYLKTQKKKHAMLSSVFLGLALLSKYAATILYPFLFFALLAFCVFHIQDENFKLKDRLKNYLWAYIFVILGAFAIFAILMPAALTNLSWFSYGVLGFWGMKQVLAAILGLIILLMMDIYFNDGRVVQKILTASIKIKENTVRIVLFVLLALMLLVIANWTDIWVFNKHLTDIPFDVGQGVSFEKTNLFNKTVLEFLAMTFTLTPLALFSLFFILGKYIIRPGRYAFLVFVSACFWVLYYLSMLYVHLMLTVRYEIMVYPLVSIMAAVGLWEFFSWKKLADINKGLVTALIIVISVFSLWSVKPFYFNYSNSLLPAKYTVNEAWGNGEYEAAQYLNSLPDAQNLAVWADQNGFCTFFVGKCIKGKSDLTKNARQNVLNIDYLVKTRRGSMIYYNIWGTINKNSTILKNQPVWQLYVNNNRQNYVQIYRAEDNNINNFFAQ